MPERYKDWNFVSRVTCEDDRVAEYTIQFYRPRADGTWYDEIRYEKRYGGDLANFLQSYNCDNASVQEITDYMDWKNLVAGLSDRDAGVGRKKPVKKR